MYNLFNKNLCFTHSYGLYNCSIENLLFFNFFQTYTECITNYSNLWSNLNIAWHAWWLGFRLKHFFTYDTATQKIFKSVQKLPKISDYSLIRSKSLKQLVCSIIINVIIKSLLHLISSCFWAISGKFDFNAQYLVCKTSKSSNRYHQQNKIGFDNGWLDII